MAGKNPSTSAPRGRKRPAGAGTWRDDAFTRLAACYVLLSRAAFDIGIKAEGSAKLSRALEDVAQARDTLGDILLKAAEVDLSRAKALDAAGVRQLVFKNIRDYGREWEYWRTKEVENRRAKGGR
jgi:hypothetical protein